MNTIEEKLWNYIDSACTAEEQKAIGLLIAQDEVYRRKYQELLKLNQEFAEMELDEPPMAFTYNVMETIRAEHAQIPLKAAINKRIIKAIGAFFGLTIIALLVFVAVNIHWVPSAAVPVKIVLPNFQKYFTGGVVEGFLFVDVVLGLYLLDAYLRKKMSAKTHTTIQTGGQKTEQ